MTVAGGAALQLDDVASLPEHTGSALLASCLIIYCLSKRERFEHASYYTSACACCHLASHACATSLQHCDR